MTFFNNNLLIAILIFFLIFFILDLLDKKYYYEQFTPLTLSNLNKLDDSNNLKIIINEINDNIIQNTYYGSKYKSDNFMLKLDDLCYDYLSFQTLNCNLSNSKIYSMINFDQNTSIEQNKQKLKEYLINEISFITQNNINFISNKIMVVVNLYFNEFIYNCA